MLVSDEVPSCRGAFLAETILTIPSSAHIFIDGLVKNFDQLRRDIFHGTRHTLCLSVHH